MQGRRIIVRKRPVVTALSLTNVQPPSPSPFLETHDPRNASLSLHNPSLPTVISVATSHPSIASPRHNNGPPRDSSPALQIMQQENTEEEELRQLIDQIAYNLSILEHHLPLSSATKTGKQRLRHEELPSRTSSHAPSPVSPIVMDVITPISQTLPLQTLLHTQRRGRLSQGPIPVSSELFITPPPPPPIATQAIAPSIMYPITTCNTTSPQNTTHYHHSIVRQDVQFQTDQFLWDIQHPPGPDVVSTHFTWWQPITAQSEPQLFALAQLLFHPDTVHIEEEDIGATLTTTVTIGTSSSPDPHTNQIPCIPSRLNDQQEENTIVLLGRGAAFLVYSIPFSILDSSSFGLSIAVPLVLRINRFPMKMIPEDMDAPTTFGQWTDAQRNLNHPIWSRDHYAPHAMELVDVLLSVLASSLFTRGLTIHTTLQCHAYMAECCPRMIGILQERLGICTRVMIATADTSGHVKQPAVPKTMIPIQNAVPADTATTTMITGTQPISPQQLQYRHYTSLTHLPEALAAFYERYPTHPHGPQRLANLSWNLSSLRQALSPRAKQWLIQICTEMMISLVHTLGLLQKHFGLNHLDTKCDNLLIKFFEPFQVYFRNMVLLHATEENREDNSTAAFVDTSSPCRQYFVYPIGKGRHFYLPNRGFVIKLNDPSMANAYRIPIFYDQEDNGTHQQQRQQQQQHHPSSLSQSPTINRTTTTLTSLMQDPHRYAWIQAIKSRGGKATNLPPHMIQQMYADYIFPQVVTPSADSAQYEYDYIQVTEQRFGIDVRNMSTSYDIIFFLMDMSTTMESWFHRLRGDSSSGKRREWDLVGGGDNKTPNSAVHHDDNNNNDDACTINPIQLLVEHLNIDPQMPRPTLEQYRDSSICPQSILDLLYDWGTGICARAASNTSATQTMSTTVVHHQIKDTTYAPSQMSSSVTTRQGAITIGKDCRKALCNLLKSYTQPPTMSISHDDASSLLQDSIHSDNIQWIEMESL